MHARPHPSLRKLDVLNFRDVTACGTNTETSLPCMFSAIGRRNYDEDRIRSSESVAACTRSEPDFSILWRDNQSGCKGVCAGLLLEVQLDRVAVCLAFAPSGRCLDDILLHGLDTSGARRAGQPGGWCCTCWATTGRPTTSATRASTAPVDADLRHRATSVSAARRRSSTPTTTRCCTRTSVLARRDRRS